MATIDEYHYKIVDETGLLHGYFETKGLAHQYLQAEHPTHEARKNSSGYLKQKIIDPVMPVGMFIKRAKKI